MSRITVVVKSVLKTAGCKGCTPAPWETEVKCDGLNCSKNLSHLAKIWDQKLQGEAREDGYVGIGEIRGLEGRIDAAEIAVISGNLESDVLDDLLACLENAKLALPREWATMPKWSGDPAELRPPDLSGISLAALESALASMEVFAKRCEVLRKEQHPGAAARCARIKAGLEKGNFKAIWDRAKAAAKVYQKRKEVAKTSFQPLKAAIWGANARIDREYAAGYTVVKGEEEEGAYLFPEIAAALKGIDLREMEGVRMSAAVLKCRINALEHIRRLEGYDWTRDFTVPEAEAVAEAIAY